MSTHAMNISSTEYAALEGLQAILQAQLGPRAGITPTDRDDGVPTLCFCDGEDDPIRALVGLLSL